jgi:hypothetical protein
MQSPPPPPPPPPRNRVHPATATSTDTDGEAGSGQGDAPSSSEKRGLRPRKLTRIKTNCGIDGGNEGGRSPRIRLEEGLNDIASQLPQLSEKMWKKIKYASKQGRWTKVVRRLSSSGQSNVEAKMLKHIAMIHRFKIRDHEEDILDRGLIDAEKKMSLARHETSKKRDKLVRYSPMRWVCSPNLVLEPHSVLRRIMNSAQTLSMLYLGFILPFELFFISYDPMRYQFKQRAITWGVIEIFVDCIYIVGFVSKFYSPYIRAEDGVWEVLPRNISWHLVTRSDFLLFVFGTVPFGLITILTGEALSLLIWRFLQVVTRYYNTLQIQTSLVVDTKKLGSQFSFLSNLLSSALLILAFLHWSTCFWFYLHEMEDIQHIMGENSLAYQKSQLYEQNLLPEGVENAVGTLTQTFELSISFYFRFAYETLMIVVGDQVDGKTPRQFVFLYIMTFIGVGIIAGLFGEVGNVIASRNKERVEYLEKMNDSLKTMGYLQLPDGLKERVVRYHEYVYNVFGGFTPNKVNNFADHLSKPLCAEVKLHCHNTLISRVSLFDNLDENISRYLIDCLKIEIYMPGDYVIREGEYDASLFMIIKGVCHVYLKGVPEPVRTLKNGEYFGELSLVTRAARSATVRAKTFCNFAVITKEDYDCVKNDHQDAFAETESIILSSLKTYKGINKEWRRRYSSTSELDVAEESVQGSQSADTGGLEKKTEITPLSAAKTTLGDLPLLGKKAAARSPSQTAMMASMGVAAKLQKKSKAAKTKVAHVLNNKLDVLSKAVKNNAKGIKQILEKFEAMEHALNETR